MAASLIPNLRYDDPDKALEFLGTAFGFEEKSVYRNDQGSVEHAELILGNGMIMIGPSGYQSPFTRFMVHPKDIQMKQTMTVYVVVPDIDDHYQQAMAAGAEILLPLTEKSYGGKDYSCRDQEGYVWSFGTYDPWK